VTGQALADELGAAFVACDVTDEDQVAAAVGAAEGLRISVCCAGIGHAEKAAGKRGAHALGPFQKVISVNLVGTFNVLRHAASAMLANQPDEGGECGVIVNTASIAAYDGQIGQIAYSASKGGVVGMTLPAARDLASARVRVCTIAPGLFDTPLLAALPEEAVEDLLSKAQFRVLRPGAVVFREGDQPGDLHLVRTGFLRVARRFGSDERVLQYFREGDVFGAVALLFNQLQSATVSANTRSEIVTIPGAAVTALLERSPDLRRTLIAEPTKAEEVILQMGSAPRPDPKDRATSMMMSLEGLVDRGVMQGHEVLLIDTSICTDCNNCVDACGRRHGYSRIERTGLQLGNMLFPSACRHCEDPVCLLCSVNGIVREPDGEIRIVPDNCIGCGACAERCPYDNIQMHELAEHKESGFLSKLFRRAEEPSAQDQLKQRLAVKCDLCAGYDYYACVHACPVGAAMRVDPVEVFGRTDLLIGLEMKKAKA